MKSEKKSSLAKQEERFILEMMTLENYSMAEIQMLDTFLLRCKRKMEAEKELLGVPTYHFDLAEYMYRQARKQYLTKYINIISVVKLEVFRLKQIGSQG